MRVGKGRKGQNTVEYLLVAAMVLAVIVAIAAKFKPHVQGAYDNVDTAMGQNIDKIAN